MLSAAAVGALALVASAAAASGYGVHLTVPAHVTPGSSFRLAVHGVAAQRSVLNVLLDHHACAKSAQVESNRIDNGGARAGDSYFVSPEGAHVIFYSVPVTGAYARDPVGYAGTRRETENLCAYLNVLNDANPRSSGSAAFASRPLKVG